MFEYIGVFINTQSLFTLQLLYFYQFQQRSLFATCLPQYQAIWLVDSLLFPNPCEHKLVHLFESWTLWVTNIAFTSSVRFCLWLCVALPLVRCYRISVGTRILLKGVENKLSQESQHKSIEGTTLLLGQPSQLGHLRV